MTTIITKHAQQRLSDRKIEKEDVQDAIENFERLEKRNNRYYCQKKFSRGTIEVVYSINDNNIIVITAYWL